ncbi:hypothetical protein [Amycolatopsis granulosa]|uniref:hypothetical protein n=1 Tax=Amycolatopsis granulosa TaxID=185684 RepID=UPI001422079C|nr:hypothetical protein [Amycolatopsis granulosa]
MPAASRYGGGRLLVWDMRGKSFVDSRAPTSMISATPAGATTRELMPRMGQSTARR